MLDPLCYLGLGTADQFLDLVCSTGGALRKLADLLGNNGKPFSRFSANRLVWKEISSMTVMIEAISRDAFSMRDMASMADPTISWDCVVLVRMVVAISVALAASLAES